MVLMQPGNSTAWGASLFVNASIKCEALPALCAAEWVYDLGNMHLFYFIVACACRFPLLVHVWLNIAGLQP